MVAIRYIPAILTALLLSMLPCDGGARTPSTNASADSLFMQSAVEVLNRDFTGPDLSYLLLDVKTAKVLAARWEHPDVPIPMGSLVKPFTALAYGEQHGYRYPSHLCRGTPTGCWLPRGHGRVSLTTAIAYSCNSYFKMLASRVDAQQMARVAARFSIESPSPVSSASAFAGIGSEWKISPLRMSRAYRELFARREQAGVRQIVEGMALSARQGTGAAVNRALRFQDALSKTGTAPCTHAQRAPGDGFVVAIWPKDEPRVLLLVRVHGAPGAEAAKVAGEILHRIGE